MSDIQVLVGSGTAIEKSKTQKKKEVGSVCWVGGENFVTMLNRVVGESPWGEGL